VWTTDKYDVTLRLTEDILGTVPKSRQVYTNFLLDRARKEVKKQGDKGVPHANGDPVTDASISALMDPEPETIAETEEKGWTSFHADKHGPFLFDYAVKGFLKEAARTLKEYDPSGGDEDDDEEEAKPKKKGVIKQLQDKVSRYVFVLPRKIYLGGSFERDPEGNIVFGNMERPLRAQTAQGPRVTVVRSDSVPAGTEVGFTIHVLKGGGITRPLLEMVFSYGNYQGLGQWRSGGYGRFDLVRLEKK
jgi:hypothetical protein